MANYLAINQLQYASSLPRDVAVNTFHFTGDGADESADALSISAKVITFFNSTPTPAANPIAYWLAAYVSRGSGASTVRVYNMGDPKPRVPIDTYPYTLGAAGATNNQPFEVSICNSVAGAPLAGVSPARRRGRQYIGPLCGASLNAGNASTPPSVHVDARQTLTEASKRMALDDSDGTQWCIWSPTTTTMVPVARGWVDDDYDTQRRRGLRSTVRTNWTLSV